MVNPNRDEGITSKLARFSAELCYEDLSPEVVDWAKYLCLDFAGVTLAGSTTPSAKVAVKAIDGLGRTGPSPIIGTPQRVLPEYAAMANGTAFHSIEMDDVNNEASLHPGVVAYPTALVMGDVVTVDGKTFITAIAAGYDVMVRLGRALRPSEHYDRGFHPTGTCGAFGAAAVASRILGLQGDTFAHALGIAGSQSSGSMEFLAQGAWTKRLHPGWASHSGIWAGLLARAGYVSPTTIIEGRDGFLHSYSGDPDAGSVLRGLGDEFQITRTGIKPHSCCRYKQGPIDCLLELREKHGLDPNEVEEVKIGVLSAGYNIICAPEEDKLNPRSVVDMQFSMPFGAAIALVYGRASLEEYAPGVAQRPEVRDMMARVRSIVDPDLDGMYPRQWPAWAEVLTRNGRTLRSEITFPKGDPENALTWEELKQKFTTLSGSVISEEQQQRVFEAVEDLENTSDVRELASLPMTG